MMLLRSAEESWNSAVLRNWRRRTWFNVSYLPQQQQQQLLSWDHRAEVIEVNCWFRVCKLTFESSEEWSFWLLVAISISNVFSWEFLTTCVCLCTWCENAKQRTTEWRRWLSLIQCEILCITHMNHTLLLRTNIQKHRKYAVWCLCACLLSTV